MRRSTPSLVVVSAAVFAVAVPRPGAGVVEDPRVFASLVSAFEVAFDYERRFALAPSLEMPLGERGSTVAGFRFESYDPSRVPASDADDFRDIGLAAHLSLRRYPWEWAPGGFAQASAGYGRRWGRRDDPLPFPAGGVPFPMDPQVIRREEERVEAALGFGYLWKAGGLLIDVRFAFGPEWITEREYDAAGGVGETRRLGDMLRFRDLEIGFSL